MNIFDAFELDVNVVNIVYYEKTRVKRFYSSPFADWFERNYMDCFFQICPDVLFRSYKFDYCITTSTPTGHVMIDLVAPGFGIAIGGNGYAGKSADEIGHVAAR